MSATRATATRATAKRGTAARDAAPEARAPQRKAKVGRVVSDKMDKTIVVSVERLSRHPLYKRVIRLTSKFAAHDEENTAHVGDTVRIEESRPLSATKRWRLVEVVQRATDTTTSIVSEEEATSEAIHSVAHPGRRDDHDEVAAGRSAEAAAAAETEATTEGSPA
jgi:small subunit ribosomal protein S17